MYTFSEVLWTAAPVLHVPLLTSQAVCRKYSIPFLCSATRPLCFFSVSYWDWRQTEMQHRDIKRAGVNTQRQCQEVGLTAEQCRIVQPGGLWGEARDSEGHRQVTLSHMSHKTGGCHSLQRSSVKMKRWQSRGVHVCLCVRVCVVDAHVANCFVCADVCPSERGHIKI